MARGETLSGHRAAISRKPGDADRGQSQAAIRGESESASESWCRPAVFRSTRVARRMAEPVVAAGTSTATFHRVRRGETISEIADEYGVTQRELRAWNQSRRPRPDPDRAEASGGLTRRPRIQCRRRPGQMDARSRTHRGAARGNARGPGETLRSLDPGPQEKRMDLSDHATLRAGVALKIPG